MAFRWRLRSDDGKVVIENLRVADTFWKRFIGLQFQKPLPRDQGLLLVPLSSLHTHWVRFSLDMIMLGADGSVLEVRRDVKPWRFVKGPQGTKAVLEVTAGNAQVEAGQRLRIEHGGGETGEIDVPTSLKFLT
jgi:uncharacterized membrane protein (UPF0127 family)